MTTEIEAGQRWRFTFSGVELDLNVTELVLEGEVVHGELAADCEIAPAGSYVTVPTGAVAAGERVT